jgi:predicted dehydrogenase
LTKAGKYLKNTEIRFAISKSMKASSVSNSGKPIVAVLGTGSIGIRHLIVLRDSLRVPTVAIPIRANRTLELKSQGFTVWATLEEAVAKGVGLTIIATDTGRHLADTRTALSLNCNVLVEKPLAATTAGLGQLAALAREKRRRLFVACNLRFDRSLLLFRQRLPEVGSLHGVRIECQSYLPDWRPGHDYRQSYCARAVEGGVLLDLVHEIDYAVWLFGVPSRVFARLGNTGRLAIQSEETADLYWETPSTAGLAIRLDYLSRRTHRTIRAYGEFGEIEWDGVAQTVMLNLVGQRTEQLSSPHARDDIMADQATAFLRAVRGGDPGTLATLEEGAITISICDAARRSSASGRMEKLADWRIA